MFRMILRWFSLVPIVRESGRVVIVRGYFVRGLVVHRWLGMECWRISTVQGVGCFRFAFRSRERAIEAARVYWDAMTSEQRMLCRTMTHGIADPEIRETFHKLAWLHVVDLADYSVREL